MSAMMTTIQNYLYGQDYRTKPQKNFILENMKRLQLINSKSKEKTHSKLLADNFAKKKKTTGEILINVTTRGLSIPDQWHHVKNVKKDGMKKKVVRKEVGDGEEIYQEVFMNSRSAFQLPVTPETEVQNNRHQKNQGCQTLASDEDAYWDGVIVSSRARPVTPPLPHGMKSVSVQAEGESYTKYADLFDSGATGDGLKSVPLKQDGKVDFVRLNAIVPLKKKTCPKKVDPTKAPPTYQKGVLPKYLIEAKKQHVEEVKLRGLVEVLEESEDPDGHVCLGEEEKKEHIKKMRKAYAKLVTELNALPIRSDSDNIRKRREEIEHALKNIEDGIKLFSRDKLYVKATTS